MNLRDSRGAVSGRKQSTACQHTIAELVSDGLLQQDGDFIRLTPRGRLLSNEVFERFIAPVRSVPIKA